MELKGSWTKLGGGTIEHISWRYNPQYLLTLEKDSKVTFTLLAEKDSKLALGLYVLRVPKGVQLPLLVDREGEESLVVGASDFRKDISQVTMDVNLKTGTSYVVIPCWNEQKKRGDFTLKSSAGKLELISSDSKHLTITGSWNEENSGGNMKCKKFKLNSSYIIKIPKKSKVTIILRKDENNDYSKIGFYVAKPTDDVKIEKLTNENLVAESGTSTPEVHLTREFSAGEYAIIPFVDPTDDHSDWTMLIISSQTITLAHTENSVPSTTGSKERRQVARAGSTKAGSNRTNVRIKESPTSAQAGKIPRSATVGKQNRAKLGAIPQLDEKLEKNAKTAAETERSEKSKSHSTSITDLEAQLFTERNKFEEERTTFVATKAQLEEEIEKLKTENVKLINDLNEIKQRKNEREELLFKELDELKTELQKYHKAEEEAEDAMDWSLPILTTVKKGTRIDIPGEWKGKSAGGCLNHLSWRHNPQIFLSTKKNTKVKITLYQPRGTGLSINFYILKTYYSQCKRTVLPFKDENIQCEAYFSDKKPSKVSAETILPQSVNPYVIIPATFLPNDESRWILSIESEEEVEARLAGDVDEWPKYEDSWSSITAAGCSNHRTFVHNPQYLFHAPSHIKITFFLLQEYIPHQTFDTIGLYILKTEHGLQKIIEYLPSKEVARVNFTNPNEVVLTADLEPGYYAIIPSTFTPDQEARFQLWVISAQHLPPNPLTSLIPRNWVTIKGTWKGETAGGSLNHKATWKNNPQFALGVKKEFDLIVRLTQDTEESTKYGIGFYIFVGDGKKVQAATTQNIVRKGEYRPDRTVKEQFKLSSRPQPYIIVPSTFSPGEECQFIIEITSEDPSFADYITLQVQD